MEVSESTLPTNKEMVHLGVCVVPTVQDWRHSVLPQLFTGHRALFCLHSLLRCAC